MLAFVASPSSTFPSGSNIAYYSYPLVFAVITLPLTAVRFKSGFGSKRRHLATETFAVEFLYSLSGALNVLLVVFTRSDILRSQGKRQGVGPEAPSTEMHPAESSQGQPQISGL
jgi:membrane protease YdiL (CAAX protease family)